MSHFVSPARRTPHGLLPQCPQPLQLLYVLFGVVGSNVIGLVNNTLLFKGFYNNMNITGNNWYTLDLLAIDPDADNNMQLVKFGGSNENNSKMDD